MIDARLFDVLADEMGWNDCNMARSRPYDGQAHTCTGTRGSAVIEGLTFRDIRDCALRAVFLSMGAISEKNRVFYTEALKGERAALCENDMYALDGSPCWAALIQNLCCEIERVMGTFPNIPGFER